MSQPSNNSQHWGSRLGVVLAVSGSAVGLGNFLRFPGQVATNGGGAFMVPYFISLLLIAIPLACSEWAIGRYGGRMGFHSPFGIFYGVGKKSVGWGMCGGFVSLVAFVIDMYYVFVAAWRLVYAGQYLGGILENFGHGFSLLPGVDPGLKLADGSYKEFFNAFNGSNADGSLFYKGSTALIVATLLSSALTFYLLYRGISQGIEKFCKLVAPLILFCSIAVIIRVVTLGNPTGVEGQSFLDGLGFMWNPTKDVVGPDGVLVHVTLQSSLMNPGVWLAATAQIFFTVSLCVGAICTYASYVHAKQDIALSSVTATVTNEFCEVCLGGLIAIPPTIMFLGANGATFDSSYTLGFAVLPNVFAQMPAGNVFGFLFFILLFFAATTTSISFALPTVAFFEETIRWSHNKCVTLALGLYLVGLGFVCYFTKDLAALNSFDFWIASFAPFLCAILQTALVVFVWKRVNMHKELDLGAQIKLPKWMGAVIAFASLPYLAIVFAFWCVKNMGTELNKVGENAASISAFSFMVLLTIAYLALSYKAAKRLKKESAAKSQEAERN